MQKIPPTRIALLGGQFVRLTSQLMRVMRAFDHFIAETVAGHDLVHDFVHDLARRARVAGNSGSMQNVPLLGAAASVKKGISRSSSKRRARLPRWRLAAA
jgi:hypothetical protein